MIPFGLLKWRLWTVAYGSVYFNGTLLFLLFPFAAPFLTKLLVPRPPKDKKDSASESLLNQNTDTVTANASVDNQNGRTESGIGDAGVSRPAPVNNDHQD